MLLEFLQLTVYGIIAGSIYALAAIGLTLTFGILKFANFSHGDVLTMGAFMAFLVLTVWQGAGLPMSSLGALSFGVEMLLATLVAMVLTALIAALMDRLVYAPLRRSGVQGASARAMLLIASVGVAFALRAVVQFIWSPQPQTYINAIQIAQNWGGIRVKPDQVFIVVLTALLVAALHLFLTRTRMGKAMRAASDNMELARVTGIDTERVVLITWLIVGALAAAAGVMAGIENKFINPELGWRMLIFVFAAAILGGIGSPYGALAGGLIIGISGELSTMVVDTVYKPVAAFVVMVLVLLVRPSGLFGSGH